MQLSRKVARWSVPAAVVAITGAAIASGMMPSAGAAPVLPTRTPAQLLADVAGTHKLPPLTGTVVETTSLGLPQLPQTGDPMSLPSLLTGSHTVKVYWQDARHFRLSVPQSMSETDVIRNGSTAWLWESGQNAATKFTANPKAMAGADNKKAGALKKARQKAESHMPQTASLTPQQAADEVLAKVGKTTVVSTQSNVDVAGQPAYQLVLAPKSAESTIGSVRVAVDGKTGVPLRMQVFAKGSKTPAFQVGYTSINYTAPSASNFNFTPPQGAKVTTPGENGAKGAGTPTSGPMAGAGTYGHGWLSVAEVPSSALISAAGNGSGASAAPSSSSSASGNSPLSGSSQQIVNAFLGSGTKVSGAWGTGQLVHTSLLNVLITGGKMYIGAVSPGVLESAVGHTTAAG